MRDRDALMPCVTVVVPTCQRPALLARALRSIAAQDVVPAEVVVVNDGPEADAAAIRRAVRESECQGVVMVPNCGAPGPSGARNTGAAHAHGEWLAFLDDDDEWLPAYQRTVLEWADGRELDVVCTDLLYRYDDGSERPGKPAFDRLAIDLFLTRNPGLIGSNLIIRRALYSELGGFDESLRCAEDNDFGIFRSSPITPLTCSSSALSRRSPDTGANG